jgi:two-component system, sensor histidine kinase and response regulator
LIRSIKVLIVVLLLIACTGCEVALAGNRAGADSTSKRLIKNEDWFERIVFYWRIDPATGTAKALEEIKLATEAGDSTALGFAWCALGINQWGRGRNVEAARSYLMAVDIGKKLGNRRLLAKTYNNLGLLYYALGSMTEAKSWFYHASGLRTSLADSSGLGRVRMNLGLVARKEGRIDSAMALFSSALRLMSDVSDSVNIARGRHYLGECQAAIDKFDEALRWYSSADSVFRRGSDRMGHALLHVDIAKAWKAKGNAMRAREAAHTALTMGEELQAPFVLRESADVLQHLYAAAGEYRQAWLMLRLSAEYADSLRHESTMQALTGLELRNMLELERQTELQHARDREERVRKELRDARVIRNITIVGLILAIAVAIGLAVGIRHVRRVNKIVTEKNREIEAMNELLRLHDASRERFFSIIGHDLRGPMGSIVEMIDLLTERENELTVSEQKQLRDVIRASAEASFASLENLLHWSRSQHGDLQSCPVLQSLRLVLDAQMAMMLPAARRKQIRLDVTGDWDRMAIFDSSILNVVLRNLISNALKFCDDGGVVLIEAAQEEGWLRITVHDNGSGIAAERLAQLRNRGSVTQAIGTTGEQGTGLGLEICHALLQCHGGHLEIQSTVGAGSAFSALIPT